MTVIADPLYLKGDFDKLEHNKYNKRDTDFSGVVLYSTPKGEFVNGWLYYKGSITGQIGEEKNSADTLLNGGNKSIQNIKTDKLVTVRICTDWYQVSYSNGKETSRVYLGLTCADKTVDDGTVDPILGGGGSSGGSGGTGGTGGTGSNPTPQKKDCIVAAANASFQGNVKVNSLKVQKVNPSDGGGFPPPTGNVPCPTDAPKNFGLDPNCLNCKIPDGNFDAFLDAARNAGLTVSDPYDDIVTVNGVQYTGQITKLTYPDGRVVYYFSPDLNSGIFQVGLEYNIGNSGSTANPSQGSINPGGAVSALPGVQFGNPSSYLGSGNISYGPSTAASRQSTLNVLINNNSSFLLNCDSLTLLQIKAYSSYGAMYQQVASFKPSQAVITRLTSLQGYEPATVINNFNLQSLKNATGPVVNSDFYPVKITSLPTGMTMASLTEYFRKNLNSFITPGNASFTPYVDSYVNDTQLFNQTGGQSVGALIHINMQDNGTVVESDYQSNSSTTYYKFSTMSSPLDNTHPVSGNREFGIYADPSTTGQHVFYTMGVDRTSDWMFATVNAFGTVFNGADSLWKDMQDHMIKYINTHGGHAGFSAVEVTLPGQIMAK